MDRRGKTVLTLSFVAMYVLKAERSLLRSSAPPDSHDNRRFVAANATFQHFSESEYDNFWKESPDKLFPHVIWEDNRFRRVCSSVYDSFLCLIVRYPNELPLERNVAALEYFHDLSENGHTLYFVDDTDCPHTIPEESSFEDSIHDCIEHVHANSKDAPRTVVALWTRQRQSEDAPRLFNTKHRSDNLLTAINRFTRNRATLFLGDSINELVSVPMASALGSCHRDRKDMTCTTRAPDPRRRRLLVDWNHTLLNESTFSVRFQDFAMNDAGKTDHFIAPGRNLSEALIHVRANFSGVRNGPLPLIVIQNHPIAHAQTHNMLSSAWDKVERNQREWAEIICTGTWSSALMQQYGVYAERLIVFDGSPQFFPTSSYAFEAAIIRTNSRQQFEAQRGYQGWQPDYGSTCTGPVPPDSLLTQANDIARNTYATCMGDLRFYGRTWEFTNLFWFQTRGWKYAKKGLDCSHGRDHHSAGLHGIHKTFLLVMIEDWWEGQ